jgi:exodeoxyribonuclease-3
MQETKVQDESFPKTALAEAGYSCVFRGQKSYNGVALAVRDVTPAQGLPSTRSRAGVTDIQFGLPQEPRDEARLLKARVGDLTLVNTYIPQGYLAVSDRFQYKLDWLARLLDYFRTSFRPSDPLLWVGDLNVAPLPIDVYDPAALLGHVCYHPAVREALEQIVRWGSRMSFGCTARKRANIPTGTTMARFLPAESRLASDHILARSRV